MADHTHIVWADATWNVINGCSVVSPGCTNCYAMKLAGTRFRDHPTRRGLTTDVTKAAGRAQAPSARGASDSPTKHVWNGQVRLIESKLDQPLRWRRPRRIFVCAHGDLFHEAVPDAWIDQVFAVMALAPQHTFQVLTKRPERMRAYLAGRETWGRICSEIVTLAASRKIATYDVHWPLPNVWLGVSVEDQARADERIPILLETPAAVRWISAEPLLGPVDLTRVGRNGMGLQGDALRWPSMRGGPSRSFGPRLDWVVAGGESGPGARPLWTPDVRAIVRQCQAAGVAVLVKQLGSNVQDRNDAGFDGCSPTEWPDPDPDRIEEHVNGFREGHQGAPVRIRLKDRKGGDMAEWPEDLRVRQWPEARP